VGGGGPWVHGTECVAAAEREGSWWASWKRPRARAGQQVLPAQVIVKVH